MTTEEQLRSITVPALYAEARWLGERLEDLRRVPSGTNVTAMQSMTWEDDVRLTQRALDAVRAELDRRGGC